MKKSTATTLVATIIPALAVIIAATIAIVPAISKPKSTPVVVIPPTELEAELSKRNVPLTEISGQESQVREWLRSDPQYQTMAQTILTLLAGKRVTSPIPLDVITSKYRVALGGTPKTNSLPENYQDIEKTKTAMFDTWKERNPVFPQKSFDEIVENIK